MILFSDWYATRTDRLPTRTFLPVIEAMTAWTCEQVCDDHYPRALAPPCFSIDNIRLSTVCFLTLGWRRDEATIHYILLDSSMSACWLLMEVGTNYLVLPMTCQVSQPGHGTSLSWVGVIVWIPPPPPPPPRTQESLGTRLAPLTMSPYIIYLRIIPPYNDPLHYLLENYTPSLMYQE